MTSNARILIACADSVAAQTLTGHLNGSGHTVCAAVTFGEQGQQAVERAADLRPDLALIDLDQDAGAVAAAIRSRLDALPIVYLVDDADHPLLDRARRTDPLGYVLKPVDQQQLRLTIDAALATHERMREQQRRAVSTSEQTLARLQDRCDLVELAIDGMSDGVGVVDADGKFVLVNRAIAELVGGDRSTSDPNEWPAEFEVFQPDERTPYPQGADSLQCAMRTGMPVSTYLFVRRRGRTDGFHVSTSARPLRDAEGRTRGGLLILKHIGDHKEVRDRLDRTLNDLQSQTELMERVFNSMRDGVAVYDSNGRYLMLNEPGQRIAGGGTDLDELAAPLDFLYAESMSPCPPEDMPTPRVLRGESFDDLNLCVVPPGKAENIYIRVSGRPLVDSKGGGIRGGISIFRDVTAERKREERLKNLAETMQEQKQAMEIVFECISDGVVAADEHGRFTIFNPSAERIVGMGATDTPPDQWSERYGLFLADQRTRAPHDALPLVRALRGESSNDVEMFIRNDNLPGGAYISVNGRPLKDAGGALKGGVIVIRDVTRLKKAEEQLKAAADRMQQQNLFMQMVFDNVSDGVVVADGNGKLTLANKSATRMVGMGLTEADSSQWSDIYGTFFPDGVTPAPAEALPLVRAMRGQSSDNVDLFIRNPHVPRGVHINVDGRPLRDASGELTGGVITFRDTTPQVRAQEALQEAFDQGRLEIIDTVLHNIGNAVNSVATGVETILRQCKDSELLCRFTALADAVAAHGDDWIHWLSTDPQGRNVRSFLLALVKDLQAQNRTLEQTADRVSGRVRHIVDVIRTQDSFTDGTVERKAVKVQEAVTDAVRVLQESFAKRAIRVVIDCDRAPDEILVQESKFHQMLINLLKNAMEAIDDRMRLEGGFDAEPRIQVVSYVEGDHLALDVIDNGVGVEPPFLKKMFSAGTTTKKNGSGLGLHSVANFVIGSGGQVTALSRGIGRGTTLRVMLRLSGAESQAAPEHA